jgi:hypothetical protein
VPLRALFERPTVAALAAHVDELRAATLVMAEPVGSGPDGGEIEEGEL